MTTTGDFFRIRYGKSLEMLYALVGLFYFGLSIALLLRGAGAAISGATGGAIPTDASVIVLSVLFSTYVMAGGLVAAAYTDFLQGLMIIALSLLLVPAGLGVVGGLSGLHEKLGPAFFAITAPHGRTRRRPLVRRHDVDPGPGGRRRPAARHDRDRLGQDRDRGAGRHGLRQLHQAAADDRLGVHRLDRPGRVSRGIWPGLIRTARRRAQASETLFGQAIQHFLGDGWRGLMIACLIAGVTSAETFMVGGSALFTRNFYVHAVPNRSAHPLSLGRASGRRRLACAGHPAGVLGRERHPARASARSR